MHTALDLGVDHQYYREYAEQQDLRAHFIRSPNSDIYNGGDADEF